MDTINGVIVGTVMQINDPMAQGRVYVQWVAARGTTQMWARVVAALRDPATGKLQLAIGDQVLLAFEQGNADHPFVLGKL